MRYWILALFLGQTALAQIAVIGEVGQGATSDANPPASPVIDQNFEGTGYDNSETWTEVTGGGTIDEDYTTTVLRDSQSLYISAPVFTTTYAKGPAIVAQSEAWAFFEVKFNTVPNDGRAIMLFWDNLGAVQMKVDLSSGDFRLVVGSVSAGSGVAHNTSDTFRIWVRYKKGTGANAEGDLYVSTTTTKPGTADATITTGTTTKDVSDIALGAPAGGAGSGIQAIFDHVYLDDEDILSNP